MRESTPVVAIFVLDGAVDLYAETSRYLAWRLASTGARVIRFGCSGALSACTSFNSINRIDLKKSDKDIICSKCKAAQSNVGAQAVFDIASSDSTASSDEEIFLSEMRDRLQKSAQVASVIDMEFEGVQVVRLAFFDFAIMTKLSHFSILDENTTTRFIAGVEDQLALLKALKRFHAQEKITHVLYINGNYSQNTLVRTFFEKLCVHCVSIEPQSTTQHVLNKVFLAKDRLVLAPEGLLAISEIDAEAAVPLRSFNEVLQTFGARIYGKDYNAYTSLQLNAETSSELARLNAFMHRFPRRHAFFLSSEDELIPHIQTHRALNNGNLFSPGDFRSQAEFTQHLLQEAGQYPEIGFVIRLHPRMAANKRDHFESEEHRKYKKLLAEVEVVDNVFVLYGDSKVSSYYVVSKSDLVITSWSTIGLEALLLGKAVISVFPTCSVFPLAAFSKQPQDKASLQAALFSKTDFGSFDDDFLIRWLAIAYEGQFFATAAPRTSNGRLGKIYQVFYRFFARHGLYSIIAMLVGLWPSAQVSRDDNVLLTRNVAGAGNTRRSLEQARNSLAEYRAKYLQQLATYGQGTQNKID